MLCQRVNCNEVGEDFKHPLSFISGHNLSSFGKESCKVVSTLHQPCCHKVSFNRTIFGILKRASIDDLFFSSKVCINVSFPSKVCINVSGICIPVIQSHFVSFSTTKTLL